jgi:hypothetical protein
MLVDCVGLIGVERSDDVSLAVGMARALDSIAGAAFIELVCCSFEYT